MGAMRAILDLMLPPACAACGSSRGAAVFGVPRCRPSGVGSRISIRRPRPGDRDRAGSLARVGRLRLRGTDPEGAGTTEVRGREPPRGAALAGGHSDARGPPADDGCRAARPGPRPPRAAPGARLQPGRAHRAATGAVRLPVVVTSSACARRRSSTGSTVQRDSRTCAPPSDATAAIAPPDRGHRRRRHRHDDRDPGGVRIGTSRRRGAAVYGFAIAREV